MLLFDVVRTTLRFQEISIAFQSVFQRGLSFNYIVITLKCQQTPESLLAIARGKTIFIFNVNFMTFKWFKYHDNVTLHSIRYHSNKGTWLMGFF